MNLKIFKVCLGSLLPSKHADMSSISRLQLALFVVIVIFLLKEGVVAWAGSPSPGGRGNVVFGAH